MSTAATSKKIHVNTRINAENMEFLCEPRHSLLEALRDILLLTGTKEGCNNGNCGACSVIMNGRLVNSCVVMAGEAEGAEITTIEGIAQNGHLQPPPNQLPGTRCASVRHLYAWLYRRGESSTGSQPESVRRRDPTLACRQSVPLHRLRQDHPSSPRRVASETNGD